MFCTPKQASSEIVSSVGSTLTTTTEFLNIRLVQHFAKPA